MTVGRGARRARSWWGGERDPPPPLLAALKRLRRTRSRALKEGIAWIAAPAKPKGGRPLRRSVCSTQDQRHSRRNPLFDKTRAAQEAARKAPGHHPSRSTVSRADVALEVASRYGRRRRRRRTSTRAPSQNMLGKAKAFLPFIAPSRNAEAEADGRGLCAGQSRPRPKARALVVPVKGVRGRDPQGAPLSRND